MGKYSIKELEQLSGIKAHTIRIREKRHNIITPSRTNTNIHFYSDDDLKKIINVSLLNNNGIKISHIADMTFEEMNRKVLEISEIRNDVTIHIDQLVIAMIDMEEEVLEKILSNFILRYTSLRLQHHPAEDHRRHRWASGSSEDRPRIILFLPEGEMHELGLLFYQLPRPQSRAPYILSWAKCSA